MRDNYDADPDEISKKLRQARARDAQLWGRKMASPEVTPAMIAHRDQGRCICDACDGTRPQDKLPAALSSRTFVNRRTLSASVSPVQERGPEDSVGSVYPPRKPVRANPPMRAPELNARQLAFLDRLRK